MSRLGIIFLGFYERIFVWSIKKAEEIGLQPHECYFLLTSILDAGCHAPFIIRTHFRFHLQLLVFFHQMLENGILCYMSLAKVLKGVPVPLIVACQGEVWQACVLTKAWSCNGRSCTC